MTIQKFARAYKKRHRTGQIRVSPKKKEKSEDDPNRTGETPPKPSKLKNVFGDLDGVSEIHNGGKYSSSSVVPFPDTVTAQVKHTSLLDMTAATALHSKPPTLAEKTGRYISKLFHRRPTYIVSPDPETAEEASNEKVLLLRGGGVKR